ncbi:hypothetical protein TVAG_105680 [Trichomonas vaginalis G3]|uniref:DUF3447 domain-containing protein n=1 Tax=Trichomonas vaginalis (strain ATCC PRA-98 / G3) TaxID=412133 RepID=A2FLQ7_TRIV3|nr:proteasome regulatory particle assembly [Trichomonas vaginalis G3]EAX94149.1 hypothetical protein TVAG_105680 [Trichomonas vaginalis G3]KAI5518084.1 proteasome regulatory particle assembly [Trichomonas vaginalis G3]|eukprot:XP_001307079.1 hypothetical protein [Trichomonas vaginalis G3]
MSDQSNYPKYSELRSMYKCDIDVYNALYQLKTENEEELNKIYKMIKTELINSKKQLPTIIIKDISSIISYNNRYINSYLYLANLIYDDYHVKVVNNIDKIFEIMFYEEYGIKLNKYHDCKKNDYQNLDIHVGNTIYRAILNNDLERFITFTGRDGFDKDQVLKSDLYPNSYNDYSLLELCCYHGAVDCFKFFMNEI